VDTVFPRDISDHALIGDMRSAALVGGDGAVDWFCPGRFDAPSVFGALLDAERGGYWSIRPADPATATSRQFYLPDTNVLVTRFSTPDGVVEVWDTMVVVRAHDAEHRQRLVRDVRGVRGSVRLRFELQPRFDYGRRDHRVQRADHGAVFDDGFVRLTLDTDLALTLDGGDASAEVTVETGDTFGSVLTVAESADAPEEPAPATSDLIDATVAFWQAWLHQSRYRGRWREAVERSALVLKLLTHEPTGAVIAAPTTSLPEVIGGERNWDYRHVWVRDAAFSMYALLRLGFSDEAGAFIEWLMLRLADEKDGGDLGPLRSMYDIDGETTSGEYTLDNWRGHRDSAPVRVRNDAADQLQLDIYGELIDSVYLYDKNSDGIGYDDWMRLTQAADWLAENWQRADEGIWETRGGRQAHTYSRVMSWVAFERLLRVARQRGLPGDLGKWMRVKDEIAASVFDSGWNEQLGAFTQFADSDVLDASLLLMPAVKFVSPSDPRYRSTVAAIEKDLVTDTLVFRYHAALSPDGLDGEEGTFSMCSFWYVEALTRTGRTPEAKLALEKMFTYANPVGLYAEEIGPDGSQLGNFPQAFTHFSLISAAVNLDRALG
jgi:GH15 family glucan-1,4-alpha-glucosidase